MPQWRALATLADGRAQSVGEMAAIVRVPQSVLPYWQGGACPHRTSLLSGTLFEASSEFSDGKLGQGTDNKIPSSQRCRLPRTGARRTPA